MGCHTAARLPLRDRGSHQAVYVPVGGGYLRSRLASPAARIGSPVSKSCAGVFTAILNKHDRMSMSCQFVISTSNGLKVAQEELRML